MREGHASVVEDDVQQGTGGHCQLHKAMLSAGEQARLQTSGPLLLHRESGVRWGLAGSWYSNPRSLKGGQDS